MRVALIALSLLLSACSSVAVDYQPDAGFPGYHTWAWSSSKDGAQSLDSQRIEKAVETSIGKTGLKKAPADQADLLIRGRVVNAKRLEQSGFSFGLGTRRDNLGFGLLAGPPVREVREGKVVVEMVDRESKRVVWHAEGKRNLSPGMSPEDRTRLINKLVAEMFSKYPPGKR